MLEVRQSKGKLSKGRRNGGAHALTPAPKLYHRSWRFYILFAKWGGSSSLCPSSLPLRKLYHLADWFIERHEERRGMVAKKLTENRCLKCMTHKNHGQYPSSHPPSFPCGFLTTGLSSSCQPIAKASNWPPSAGLWPTPVICVHQHWSHFSNINRNLLFSFLINFW